VRGILESLQDSLEHGIGFFQRLIVPEPQKADAAFRKASFSLLVAGGLLGQRVATPVEFNPEACVRTIEIQDESTDGVLAAELPSLQPTIAKVRPDSYLRVGRHVAHAACPLPELWTRLSHHHTL